MYQYFIQNDFKYQNQILANNNFDYAQAQSYYLKTKQAMLNSLSAETQSQMLKTTINKTTEDLEKQIIDTANAAALDSSAVLNKAKQALSELNQQASGSLNSLSLKRAITKAVKQAEQGLTKSQSEYKNFSSTFTQKVRTSLNEQASRTVEEMLKSTSFYSGASNLVKANMRNYLLRNLIQQSLLRNKSSLSITTAANKYAQTIGGYFKEEAVVDAFNKANRQIQQTKQRSMPQAIDVASKNLPSDFLFQHVINQEEIDKLCSQIYTGVSKSQLISPEIEQSFINSISAFGAQIKSYNLLDTNGKITRNYFPIGVRSSLKSGLENNEEYLYGYSMAANMAYMGQKHNIITALGINNVMFIAGNKAYWMDEFIKEFRQQKLYLSLDTQGKTLETFELTAHVSLLKYTKSLMYQMFNKNKEWL